MNTPSPKIDIDKKTIHRFSSRKKSLFSSSNENTIDADQTVKNCFKINEYELDGIRPLDSNTSMNDTIELMLHNIPSKKVISFLENKVISNSENCSYLPTTQSPTSKYIATSTSTEINNTPIKSSSRLKAKSKSIKSLDYPIPTRFSILKTPEQCTPKTPKNQRRSNPDELNQLFRSSLRIRNKNEAHNDVNDLIVEETPFKLVEKRRIEIDTSEHNESMQQPERKIFKIDDIQISTKAFYSNKIDKPIAKTVYSSSCSISPSVSVISACRKLSPNVKRVKVHNARAKPYVFKNKKLKNHLLKQCQNKWKKLSIDDFLKTITSTKFKSLPSKRLLPAQIEEVHKIIQLNKNPIEMAKPLSLKSKQNDADFSDLETSDEENDININNESSEKNNLAHNTKKKFFKSGVTGSKKRVQITETINATLSDGKLTLDQIKKKHSKRHKSKADELFAKEQERINNIIETLDAENYASTSHNPKIEGVNKTPLLNNELNRKSKILSKNETTYSEFYSRIPYKTSDQNKIEEQKVLIDFLVANNICNEENFEIFITNPEDHASEAEFIVDNIEKKMIQIRDYPEFANRIPYNTNDSGKIEQQYLLLEFLIQNEICTEQNFNIFIADPDNHKEEAEAIVNSLIMLSTNDTNVASSSGTEALVTVENMNIDIPQEISENNSQNSFRIIDSSHKNNLIPNENQIYYPIFYPGKCNPLQKKSTRSKTFTSLTKAAVGLNQYQIDAGQKKFGAQTCNQCGLIYSAHEPEEEKIHTEYHQSLHVLKFRGWIDEDIVFKNELWGSDGRIVRITSFSHINKKHRLMEILNDVVDKELGFSSYILPKTYVSFLAVRRQQIVGVCLVQFLDSANRYVCENSVDCCTEASFDAKCGISRIWVSPFHRKIGIASALVECVQQNTIPNECIDIDLIAFSSPTEDGKAFAKKISKRDDFLVYQ